MWIVTIIYGDMLILLGVAGWLMIHGLSLKAWIPAVFGVILNVLGALSRSDKLRKHTMHTAVLLAVVAVVGAFPAVLDLNGLASGDPTVHVQADYIKLAMVMLSVIYIALCVKSFVDARVKSRS